MEGQMCGRFSLTAPPSEVRAHFDFEDAPNFPPRYNIAPTQPIGVVRLENGERRFRLVRWGLIPPWVKDPKAFTLLINARSETAAEKPAFKLAMRRRRCIVPANGFYEWQRMDAKNKQAYWVPERWQGVFGFAGIYEAWMGPDGEEMETAAILTTAANDTLKDIHARMPVVIPKEHYARWLDCAEDDATPIKDLLEPAANDFFKPIPVSDRVGSVRHDDARLQERVPAKSDVSVEHAVPKRASPKTDDQMDLF